MPAIPSPRSQRRHRLEIIPLIDIMFFLLATFLMVSLSLLPNEGITLQLPAARTSTSTEDDTRSLTLSVSREGQIYFQQQPVALEELPQRLADLKRSAPDTRLILQGDEGAAFGRVVTVLDEARRQGLARLTLRTRSPDTH
jgi:biopolymer transport protein ExbD